MGFLYKKAFFVCKDMEKAWTCMISPPATVCEMNQD